MRVVFAGTPEFALVALRQLHEAGFEIVLVLTQPDRPAGRGMRAQPSPVKAFATQQQLPLMQPQGLGERFAEAQALREAVLAAQADVMVVAAYGLLLPAWLLQLPRWGCLNIHASLLPRWRGAAPIQRAIEAGDLETGVSIMQMDAGLDTGDILLMEKLPILAQDTAASLQDKLATLGADLMVEALHLREAGRLSRLPQPDTGISYARKTEKHEARIDWASPAALIERRLRAFDPFPGASTGFGADTVKVWAAEPLTPNMPLEPTPRPGTVVAVAAGGIVVAAGDALLRLTCLQRSGGKRLGAAEFLRGFEVRPGLVLE